MLRTSHGANEHGGRSLLPVVSDDRATNKTEDALREEALQVERANESYLWLLVLAAAAECATTCFLPELAFTHWRLNASATALNFIGPFLDGLTYGYEDLPKQGEPSVACLQFRSAFLGYGTNVIYVSFLCEQRRLTTMRVHANRVFTSFSFMADHAGDLSTQIIAAGVLYVCASVVGGCWCFLVGKAVVRPVLTSPPIAGLLHTISHAKKPSLLSTSVAFIGLSTLRAVFGPHGFVRCVHCVVPAVES